MTEFDRTDVLTDRSVFDQRSNLLDGDSAGARVDIVLTGTELRISGRLDRSHAGLVREALQASVDSGTGDLVVHLDQIEVTDAAGLGVLVGVDRRARLGGRRLVLVGVPVRLERLIRHTRLHRVLVRAQAPALA